MADEPGEGRRPRPRRRARGGSSGAAASVEGHSRRAAGALQDLLVALAQTHGLSPGDVAVAMGEVPLQIRLDAGAVLGSREAAAQKLLSDLERQVGEALQGAGLRPGFAYCFLCASSQCVHAAPPQRDQTLASYAASGRPVWQSFTNLCLAQGEERVDRLFVEPPEIIALALHGGPLRRELGAAGGGRGAALTVLGQVVVGLIPEDFALRRSTADRIALTLQLVEVAGGDPLRRWRINVLGLERQAIAEAAAREHARGPAERLRRLLAATEQRAVEAWRRVRALRGAARGRAREREAMALINGLRGEVERVFRPLQRRTQHAQERHEGGERPTSDALRDVENAGAEHFFWDRRHGTLAVLGPRGRAHLFSPAGRHVTSLRLQRGELERKSGQGWWVAVAAAEVERLRALVVRGAHGDEAPPA